MQKLKVALVTDGMGGLGTALCRRLDAAGFQVATTYSPAHPSPQGWLAAQRDEGCRIQAYKVDVSNFADAEWMMQKLLAEMGRLDVLVNNAGITGERSVHTMSPADWSEVLRTNLDSVFNMSKQALEPMLAQRWGRIVNMSSVCAQQGAARQAHYAAAKAGMHGFTKALALEVARHGITVNTVSPGHLGTGMGGQTPEPSLPSALLAQIPVGRLGEPAEVAALVAYLASEEAAFVTGANIAINGGQHMS